MINCRKTNKPFPSSPGPLFQNESGCSAFDLEMIFHTHANKTHFHKKGCAPSLILKVRVFGARKWPIRQPVNFQPAQNKVFITMKIVSLLKHHVKAATALKQGKLSLNRDEGFELPANIDSP